MHRLHSLRPSYSPIQGLLISNRCSCCIGFLQLHDRKGVRGAHKEASFEDHEKQLVARRRATDRKRRQDGQRFVDEVRLIIHAGKGGDGGIAFNRDKMKSFGPASGGNGGQGGSIFIKPTTRVNSLSQIPRSVKAQPGGNGSSAWRHGKRGEDITIEVPYGTTVHGEYVPEEEEVRQLSKFEKWRSRWVHQSGFEEANEKRDAYVDANRALDVEEAHKAYEWAVRCKTPLKIDYPEPPSMPVRKKEIEKVQPQLLLAGGQGGLGNPAYLSIINRSPKFASRGSRSGSMKLHLQLKLIADVGLVGLPNAGKSSLVRALTGLGTEVGSWAFTTLNPSIGVVRVWEGGSYGGVSGRVVDESIFEVAQEDVNLARGEGTTPIIDPRHLKEQFRFTIADNPGLIADASKNVGLGHSFLKSIERSKALVYVVDLAATGDTGATDSTPEKALLTLREELEAYKSGLSNMARLVIANKADLLVPSVEGAETSELEARAKERLAELQLFVAKEFKIEVIPVSAKWGMNLESVVQKMKSYIEEARGEDTIVDADQRAGQFIEEGKESERWLVQ